MQCANGLFFQLTALNNLILEHLLVESIIRGLGDAYHPFTPMMEACLELISFVNLYGSLLNKELQIGAEANPLVIAPPTSHYMNQQQTLGQKKGYRGGHGCGQYRLFL